MSEKKQNWLSKLFGLKKDVPDPPKPNSPHATPTARSLEHSPTSEHCPYFIGGKCQPPLPALAGSNCSYTARDYDNCAMYKAIATVISGGTMQDALKAANVLSPDADVAGSLTSQPPLATRAKPRAMAEPVLADSVGSGGPASDSAARIQNAQTEIRIPPQIGHSIPSFDKAKASAPNLAERGAEDPGMGLKCENRDAATIEATRSTMLTLVLLAADGTEASVHRLPTDCTTFVGSAVAGSNALLVEGQGVAGAHCHIKTEGKACFIVNQASTGTFVNGQRVIRSQLHDGDIIAIGNVKIRFSTVVGKSAPSIVPNAASIPVKARAGSPPVRVQSTSSKVVQSASPARTPEPSPVTQNCCYFRAGKCMPPIPALAGTKCSYSTRDYENCGMFKVVATAIGGGNAIDALRASGLISLNTDIAGACMSKDASPRQAKLRTGTEVVLAEFMGKPVIDCRNEKEPVYSEVPIHPGDGRCSDRSCPCPEPGALLPRGTGYLYISPQAVEFRRDCKTQQEFAAKMERLQSGDTLYSFHGAPESIAPILVCEQGARKRGLDLEIAAADAKRWWATGKVPLRPTPLSLPHGKTEDSAIAAGIQVPAERGEASLPVRQPSTPVPAAEKRAVLRPKEPSRKSVAEAVILKETGQEDHRQEKVAKELNTGNIADASYQELIARLRTIALAFTDRPSAPPDLDSLEKCTQASRLIGEELNKRGGMKMMQTALIKDLASYAGCRNIEFSWWGVGDWQG